MRWWPPPQRGGAQTTASCWTNTSSAPWRQPNFTKPSQAKVQEQLEEEAAKKSLPATWNESACPAFGNATAPPSYCDSHSLCFCWINQFPGLGEWIWLVSGVVVAVMFGAFLGTDAPEAAKMASCAVMALLLLLFHFNSSCNELGLGLTAADERGPLQDGSQPGSLAPWLFEFMGSSSCSASYWCWCSVPQGLWYVYIAGWLAIAALVSTEDSTELKEKAAMLSVAAVFLYFGYFNVAACETSIDCPAVPGYDLKQYNCYDNPRYFEAAVQAACSPECEGWGHLFSTDWANAQDCKCTFPEVSHDASGNFALFGQLNRSAPWASQKEYQETAGTLKDGTAGTMRIPTWCSGFFSTSCKNNSESWPVAPLGGAMKVLLVYAEMQFPSKAGQDRSKMAPLAPERWGETAESVAYDLPWESNATGYRCKAEANDGRDSNTEANVTDCKARCSSTSGCKGFEWTTSADSSGGHRCTFCADTGKGFADGDFTIYRLTARSSTAAAAPWTVERYAEFPSGGDLSTCLSPLDVVEETAAVAVFNASAAQAYAFACGLYSQTTVKYSLLAVGPTASNESSTAGPSITYGAPWKTAISGHRCKADGGDSSTEANVTDCKTRCSSSSGCKGFEWTASTPHRCTFCADTGQGNADGDFTIYRLTASNTTTVASVKQSVDTKRYVDSCPTGTLGETKCSEKFMCWCSWPRFIWYLFILPAFGSLAILVSEFVNEGAPRTDALKRSVPQWVMTVVVLAVCFYNANCYDMSLLECPATTVNGTNALAGFDCYDSAHAVDFVNRVQANVGVGGCASWFAWWRDDCREGNKVKLAFVGTADHPAAVPDGINGGSGEADDAIEITEDESGLELALVHATARVKGRQMDEEGPRVTATIRRVVTTVPPLSATATTCGSFQSSDGAEHPIYDCASTEKIRASKCAAKTFCFCSWPRWLFWVLVVASALGFVVGVVGYKNSEEASALGVAFVAFLMLVFSVYSLQCYDVTLDGGCPVVSAANRSQNVLAGFDCYGADEAEAFSAIVGGGDQGKIKVALVGSPDKRAEIPADVLGGSKENKLAPHANTEVVLVHSKAEFSDAVHKVTLPVAVSANTTAMKSESSNTTASANATECLAPHRKTMLTNHSCSKDIYCQCWITSPALQYLGITDEPVDVGGFRIDELGTAQSKLWTSLMVVFLSLTFRVKSSLSEHPRRSIFRGLILLFLAAGSFYNRDCYSRVIPCPSVISYANHNASALEWGQHVYDGERVANENASRAYTCFGPDGVQDFVRATYGVATTSDARSAEYDLPWKAPISSYRCKALAAGRLLFFADGSSTGTPTANATRAGAETGSDSTTEASVDDCKKRCLAKAGCMGFEWTTSADSSGGHRCQICSDTSKGQGGDSDWTIYRLTLHAVLDTSHLQGYALIGSVDAPIEIADGEIGGIRGGRLRYGSPLLLQHAAMDVEKIGEGNLTVMETCSPALTQKLGLLKEPTDVKVAVASMFQTEMFLAWSLLHYAAFFALLPVLFPLRSLFLYRLQRPWLFFWLRTQFLNSGRVLDKQRKGKIQKLSDDIVGKKHSLADEMVDDEALEPEIVERKQLKQALKDSWQEADRKEAEAASAALLQYATDKHKYSNEIEAYKAKLMGELVEGGVRTETEVDADVAIRDGEHKQKLGQSKRLEFPTEAKIAAAEAFGVPKSWYGLPTKADLVASKRKELVLHPRTPDSLTVDAELATHEAAFDAQIEAQQAYLRKQIADKAATVKEGDKMPEYLIEEDIDQWTNDRAQWTLNPARAAAMAKFARPPKSVADLIGQHEDEQRTKQEVKQTVKELRRGPKQKDVADFLELLANSKAKDQEKLKKRDAKLKDIKRIRYEERAREFEVAKVEIRSHEEQIAELRKVAEEHLTGLAAELNDGKIEKLQKKLAELSQLVQDFNRKDANDQAAHERLQVEYTALLTTDEKSDKLEKLQREIDKAAPALAEARTKREHDVWSTEEEKLEHEHDVEWKEMQLKQFGEQIDENYIEVVTQFVKDIVERDENPEEKNDFGVAMQELDETLKTAEDTLHQLRAEKKALETAEPSGELRSAADIDADIKAQEQALQQLKSNSELFNLFNVEFYAENPHYTLIPARFLIAPRLLIDHRDALAEEIAAEEQAADEESKQAAKNATRQAACREKLKEIGKSEATLNTLARNVQEKTQEVEDLEAAIAAIPDGEQAKLAAIPGGGAKQELLERARLVLDGFRSELKAAHGGGGEHAVDWMAEADEQLPNDRATVQAEITKLIFEAYTKEDLAVKLDDLKEAEASAKSEIANKAELLKRLEELIEPLTDDAEIVAGTIDELDYKKEKIAAHKKMVASFEKDKAQNDPDKADEIKRQETVINNLAEEVSELAEGKVTKVDLQAQIEAARTDSAENAEAEGDEVVSLLSQFAAGMVKRNPQLNLDLARMIKADGQAQFKKVSEAAEAKADKAEAKSKRKHELKHSTNITPDMEVTSNASYTLAAKELFGPAGKYEIAELVKYELKAAAKVKAVQLGIRAEEREALEKEIRKFDLARKDLSDKLEAPQKELQPLQKEKESLLKEKADVENKDKADPTDELRTAAVIDADIEFNDEKISTQETAIKEIMSDPELLVNVFKASFYKEHPKYFDEASPLGEDSYYTYDTLMVELHDEPGQSDELYEGETEDLGEDGEPSGEFVSFKKRLEKMQKREADDEANFAVERKNIEDQLEVEFLWTAKELPDKLEKITKLVPCLKNRSISINTLSAAGRFRLGKSRKKMLNVYLEVEKLKSEIEAEDAVNDLALTIHTTEDSKGKKVEAKLTLKDLRKQQELASKTAEFALEKENGTDRADDEYEREMEVQHLNDYSDYLEAYTDEHIGKKLVAEEGVDSKSPFLAQLGREFKARMRTSDFRLKLTMGIVITFWAAFQIKDGGMWASVLIFPFTVETLYAFLIAWLNARDWKKTYKETSARNLDEAEKRLPENKKKLEYLDFSDWVAFVLAMVPLAPLSFVACPIMASIRMGQGHRGAFLLLITYWFLGCFYIFTKWKQDKLRRRMKPKDNSKLAKAGLVVSIVAIITGKRGANGDGDEDVDTGEGESAADQMKEQKDEAKIAMKGAGAGLNGAMGGGAGASASKAVPSVSIPTLPAAGFQRAISGFLDGLSFMSLAFLPSFDWPSVNFGGVPEWLKFWKNIPDLLPNLLGDFSLPTFDFPKFDLPASDWTMPEIRIEGANQIALKFTGIVLFVCFFAPWWLKRLGKKGTAVDQAGFVTIVFDAGAIFFIKSLVAGIICTGYSDTRVMMQTIGNMSGVGREVTGLTDYANVSGNWSGVSSTVQYYDQYGNVTWSGSALNTSSDFDGPIVYSLWTLGGSLLSLKPTISHRGAVYDGTQIGQLAGPIEIYREYECQLHKRSCSKTEKLKGRTTCYAQPAARNMSIAYTCRTAGGVPVPCRGDVGVVFPILSGKINNSSKAGVLGAWNTAGKDAGGKCDSVKLRDCGKEFSPYRCSFSTSAIEQGWYNCSKPVHYQCDDVSCTGQNTDCAAMGGNLTLVETRTIAVMRLGGMFLDAAGFQPESSMKCWEGGHIYMGFIAVLVLPYFYGEALRNNYVFQKKSSVVIFDQLYLLVCLQIKFTVSIAASSMGRCHPKYMLSILWPATLAQFIMTVGMAPCNIRTIDHLKTITLASALWSLGVTTSMALGSTSKLGATCGTVPGVTAEIDSGGASEIHAQLLSIGGSTILVVGIFYILYMKAKDAKTAKKEQKEMELHNMREMFQQQDKDHGGFLDKDEVRLLMITAGRELSEKEFLDIWDEMDSSQGDDGEAVGDDGVDEDEFIKWWGIHGRDSVKVITQTSVTYSDTAANLAALEGQIETADAADEEAFYKVMLNKVKGLTLGKWKVYKAKKDNDTDAVIEAEQELAKLLGRRKKKKVAPKDYPTLVVDMKDLAKSTEEVEKATWKLMIESPVRVEVINIDIQSASAQVLIKMAGKLTPKQQATMLAFELMRIILHKVTLNNLFPPGTHMPRLPYLGSNDPPLQCHKDYSEDPAGEIDGPMTVYFDEVAGKCGGKEDQNSESSLQYQKNETALKALGKNPVTVEGLTFKLRRTAFADVQKDGLDRIAKALSPDTTGVVLEELQFSLPDGVLVADSAKAQKKAWEKQCRPGYEQVLEALCKKETFTHTDHGVTYLKQIGMFLKKAVTGKIHFRLLAEKFFYVVPFTTDLLEVLDVAAPAGKSMAVKAFSIGDKVKLSSDHGDSLKIGDMCTVSFGPDSDKDYKVKRDSDSEESSYIKAEAMELLPTTVKFKRGGKINTLVLMPAAAADEDAESAEDTEAAASENAFRGEIFKAVIAGKRQLRGLHLKAFDLEDCSALKEWFEAGKDAEEPGTPSRTGSSPFKSPNKSPRPLASPAKLSASSRNLSTDEHLPLIAREDAELKGKSQEHAVNLTSKIESLKFVNCKFDKAACQALVDWLRLRKDNKLATPKLIDLTGVRNSVAAKDDGQLRFIEDDEADYDLKEDLYQLAGNALIVSVNFDTRNAKVRLQELNKFKREHEGSEAKKITYLDLRSQMSKLKTLDDATSFSGDLETLLDEKYAVDGESCEQRGLRQTGTPAAAGADAPRGRRRAGRACRATTRQP